MADYFERNLLSIEGEGPSQDFVSSLRKSLVDELAKPVGPTDDEDVIVIDHRPNERDNEMTKKRWVLLGAAAAVVVIAGFVVLSGNSGDDEIETINDSEQLTTTTSQAVTTTTEEASAPPTSTETVPQGPATFASDAPLLTAEFAPVEAGTHRVDTLGTPLSFNISETLFVQPNNLGQFVLTHAASQGPDDRDIVFIRFNALWDPANPSTQPEDLGAGWPADDFEGWLDNLADGIVVTNREDTELGGLAATRIDLEVDPSACSDHELFCVGFASNGGLNVKQLNSDARYRIWIVEQENQSPLAVVVGNRDKVLDDWFDTAEAILSTLSFGDVAPNPIITSPGGVVKLPLLGGISTELADGTVITQDTANFGRILLGDEPGDTKFLTNPLDLEGNTLGTSDEVVDLLGETSIDVTELGSTTVGGIEARVLGVSGRTSDSLLKRNSGDESGWRPPPLGQIWLLEHPERGLLMITAESFDSSEETFALVLAQSEDVIGSLEFVELE